MEFCNGNIESLVRYLPTERLQKTNVFCSADIFRFDAASIPGTMTTHSRKCLIFLGQYD